MFSLINNNFTSSDLISKNNCLNYDSNNDMGFVIYKITDNLNTITNKFLKKINHDAKLDISTSNFNLKMTGFIIIQNKLPFFFRLTTTGPTKIYFNFSTDLVFNTSNDYQTTTLSKKFASIKKGIYTFYIERDTKASYSTSSFNLEYSNDNGSNWNSIDKLLLNCTTNTLDKSFYANQFTQDMINKCANNITDTKCQNFYNNIEQYIFPNYSLANNLAVVNGQYGDWTSYEQWTENSCGRQAKRSTRNYISEENGGTPITNPELVRYQDEYCVNDTALDSAWNLTSCKNSFPSELNREELKYYTGYLQSKFSKWETHDNSTVSKQCFNSKITSGTTIRKGQRVYSPSNTYYLTYQSDGNVCLNKADNSPVWCAQTQTSASTNLTFKDGNLMLYNGTSIVWQSGTNTFTDAYLEINDDGRLYIKTANNEFILYYGIKYTEFPTGIKIMKPPKGDDHGSFKLYSDDGYFSYQPDGNLVIYNNSKNPIWASGTSNQTHTHLILETNGNLVLFNGSNILWESKTNIGYNLKLRLFKTYLILVYGNNEIVKVINVPSNNEIIKQVAKTYIYDEANTAPSYIARNIDGSFWRIPNEYFTNDGKYPGSTNQPLSGGTWKNKDSKNLVYGWGWQWENSLFEQKMKKLNTTTYKWDPNSSEKIGRSDTKNNTYWETNSTVYYDSANNKKVGSDYNTDNHLYRIKNDPGIIGYERVSDTGNSKDYGNGTRERPYLLATDGSDWSCCYPVFKLKSKDDFANDILNNSSTNSYVVNNKKEEYKQAILILIGASDTYTRAGLFRAAFTNKDMFINRRKEGLDDLTICNLENIFNDNNCNSDLNKAYKDYLTSMDKYCNNEKNMLSNDCISYFNTSFTGDDGIEVIPNKLKKGILEKKYISKCRDKKCEDICNENLGLRFNKEVCIKADLEDKKAIQDAADLKAAEDKAAEEKKNKIIFIILFIVLVTLFGIYFFKKKKSEQPRKRRPARQEQEEEQEEQRPPPRLTRQNAMRQGMR